jgi:hypothetical protein
MAPRRALALFALVAVALPLGVRAQGPAVFPQAAARSMRSVSHVAARAIAGTADAATTMVVAAEEELVGATKALAP